MPDNIEEAIKTKSVQALTEPTIPAKPVPISRDALRARIFAAENKRGKSTIVEFFGTDIELREPSVGDIQRLGERLNDEKSIGFVQILIDYAYVPGTDDKAFEEGDMETLSQLTFGADVQRVLEAVEGFTNLSIKDAEKN